MTAELVRAACWHWPGFTGELADAAGQLPVRRGSLAGGRVVLITGPAGVGKSTIGFRCLAIDTGGLSPEESASAIATTIGWPDVGP